MNRLLVTAFDEVRRLPDREQEALAATIIHIIHGDLPNAPEDAEWDRLLASPESQAFLEEMATKVRAEETTGRTLDIDPAALAIPHDLKD